MLPIRNISYLSPMSCNFWEKFINSHKIGEGSSTSLKLLFGNFCWVVVTKLSQKYIHVEKFRWFWLCFQVIHTYKDKLQSDPQGFFGGGEDWGSPSWQNFGQSSPALGVPIFRPEPVHLHATFVPSNFYNFSTFLYKFWLLLSLKLPDKSVFHA